MIHFCRFIYFFVLTTGCASMTFAKSIDCPSSDGQSKISVQLTTDGKLAYDPTTTGFAHITFYNAVLGRLIRLNANLTFQPGLLEDAYWDYKNEQYILKLKSTLKFHNGRSVKAEDLDFSLVRFFLSTNRVDQIAFLKHIKGVEKLSPGMSYRPWSVDGIKKIDEHTVAIKLAAPNPAFLYSLAEGWASLVPREELKEDYVTWKTIPIGAGPYKVQRVDGHRIHTCRVDPDDFAPSSVEFVSYETPNADIVGFVNSNASAKTLKKIYGSGPIGFTGIFFNANNVLGSNPHFRKALSLAIRRRELVNDNPDFSVLMEMLTSNFYGRITAPERFDLEVAKTELAKVPSHLVKLPIKCNWFSGRTTLAAGDKHVVETLKKQFRQIGLEIEFGPTNHPTFAPNDSETVLRIDDRGTAFPDPLVIFRAFEKPAFLSPFFPKDNSVLKSLLTTAAQAQSLDVKANAIFTLSKYFDENVILIPLYERRTVYWMNPNKVASLGIQTGITFDIERVRLAKKK